MSVNDKCIATLKTKGTPCKFKATCNGVCGVHIKQHECPICYDALSKATVHTLACGHNFHTTCVSQWLKDNTSCPMCRATVWERSSEDCIQDMYDEWSLDPAFVYTIVDISNWDPIDTLNMFGPDFIAILSHDSQDSVNSPQ